MRIVQFGARRGSGPAPGAGEARLVHDILWAHAGPDTGLEHLRVRADPDGLALSFLLAEHARDPLGQVDRLIGDALARSPYLARYHFTRTDHESAHDEGEDT